MADANAIVASLHRAAAVLGEHGENRIADALLLFADHGLPLHEGLGLAATWHNDIRRRQRDAALVALAAEFHRLDAQLRPRGTDGDTTPDETYEAIQEQWWRVARQIEAIPATTREGLAAKASIIAPVINDTTDIANPSAGERLALALARDLGPAVPSVAVAPNPDAELIAVCDRIVALEARYDSIYLTIADDDEAERAAAPLAPEFAEAERQLHALDIPRTMAGQRAFARAAVASAQRHADGSIILDDGGSIGSYLAFGLAHSVAGDVRA